MVPRLTTAQMIHKYVMVQVGLAESLPRVMVQVGLAESLPRVIPLLILIRYHENWLCDLSWPLAYTH